MGARAPRRFAGELARGFVPRRPDAAWWVFVSALLSGLGSALVSDSVTAALCGLPARSPASAKKAWLTACRGSEPTIGSPELVELAT